MMHYTRAPKASVFDLRLTGVNKDDCPVEVLVEHHNDTRYATFSMDGTVVYRRQYSGRNLAELESALDDLRAGLASYSEVVAY